MAQPHNIIEIIAKTGLAENHKMATGILNRGINTKENNPFLS
ncbi:hypothetical protein [Clostridium saccharoperbutylacetonicum]